MKISFSQILEISILLVVMVVLVSCDQTGISGLQDVDGDGGYIIDGDADTVGFVDGDQDDAGIDIDGGEDDYVDGDRDSFVDGDDSCVCDCDCGVNRAVVPRWVLRDKDGLAVPIITEPRRYVDFTDGLMDIGQTLEVKSFTGGLGYGVYSLKNGKMQENYTHHDSWKAEERGLLGVKYRDADCSTSYYAISGFGSGLHAAYLNVGGTMYSAWGQPDYTESADYDYYEFSNIGEGWACNFVENPGNAYMFFEYRPIPDEVENRFLKPPYTIAMEY